MRVVRDSSSLTSTIQKSPPTGGLFSSGRSGDAGNTPKAYIIREAHIICPTGQTSLKKARFRVLFSGCGRRICSRLRARSGRGLTAHRAVIQHAPVQILLPPNTKKTTRTRKGCALFWLRKKDLNPHRLSQSQACCRYTIPQRFDIFNIFTQTIT